MSDRRNQERFLVMWRFVAQAVLLNGIEMCTTGNKNDIFAGPEELGPDGATDAAGAIKYKPHFQSCNLGVGRLNFTAAT
jgi:hypothetical protein